MPLLDHFHPPLSELRAWESFHARWAARITDVLEEDVLPPGYFAEMQSHLGSRVEYDVGALERGRHSGPGPADVDDGSGGTATVVSAPARAWAPPAAAMEMPTIFPDSIEVLVYNRDAGPTLVAAIELVSPRNKDRPDARRAFASKCAAYLQGGVAVVVVDIVTVRRANLHNDLVDELAAGARFMLPAEPLYAVAYRPSRTKAGDRVQVWPGRVAVGEPLPLLPLPLSREVFVPLDLEATYLSVLQRMRKL